MVGKNSPVTVAREKKREKIHKPGDPSHRNLEKRKMRIIENLRELFLDTLAIF